MYCGLGGGMASRCDEIVAYRRMLEGIWARLQAGLSHIGQARRAPTPLKTSTNTEIEIITKQTISLALLQKLLQIYKQSKLHTEPADDDLFSCAYAYTTNDNELLYKIQYSNSADYWELALHPHALGKKYSLPDRVRFDGSYFCNESRDYIKLLYDITRNGITEELQPAITALEQKTLQPLRCHDLWKNQRMVFLYLDNFLKR